MTRTNAREIVVHLIYGINYTKETADEAMVSRFAQDYYETLQEENDIYAERPNQKQLAYIAQVVNGIEQKQEELNGYITKYAIGWNLDRISRLARSIMQLAMYESLYVEDVPTSAAISEAVELTRKYEDEDVVSFVNGILGSFAREVAQ
ncbi:transcription antitermination factor NusB [Candidatus Avoscillospira sp. LCP25S3_F1]|uniref:transcription antitermination factor NusB n=1 Tax=Candidatus Avoscillospira sp. LCP25S3_F1 TaxID=3438825 RepID=UPI003F92E314